MNKKDFIRRKMCTGGDKRLSRLVQIALFKCGYKWEGYTNRAQEVRHCNKQYLYIGTDGLILHGTDFNMYKHSSDKVLGLSEAKKMLDNADEIFDIKF